MKKTFKVVMLPTNEKVDIGAPNWWLPNQKKLIINNLISNIYILSDEEIKEGDWAICGNEIFQSKTDEHKGIFKKIVATTDQLETTDEEFHTTFKQAIHKIPESFIQAYIKAYNDAKPITEVDLEIEWWMPCPTGNFTKEDYGYKIKTRPDNTVIVHQSKMYSRDELIIFCNKAFNDSKINAITWDEWKQNNLS